ncbi:MAG: hypothetical protein ABIS17_06795 [Casimicrobiaceae bacterium]
MRGGPRGCFHSEPDLFGTPREPLWSLLYRYWFWGWLFRDMNLGDSIHRQASWRHNMAMRACLPTYMGRWLTCTTASALVAQGVEASTATGVLPALFYMGSVLGSVVFTMAATIWMFLARGGH